MHIWTETPLTEIWHQLRYLESQANICNLLTGKIQSKRSVPWTNLAEAEKRSHEIASCIKQADEYFAASEQVGLTTKPLLQFYGTEALAKALILANDPNVELGNIKYHGLSSRPNAPSLKTYDELPETWQVESEFAVTNDGVFPQLCGVVNDVTPPKSSILKFQELIRVIPDISDLYQRHYGEASYCFYLYQEPRLNLQGQYEVFFRDKQDLDSVTDVFPEFLVGYERVEPYPPLGFRSTAILQQLPTVGHIEKGAVAGSYFVRPHSCGMHRPITAIFAALYILSNIVRYKPAFWMDVIQGRQTGAVSIAEALCNLARRRFPNDVLQGIWQEEFVYKVPAYPI